MSQILEFVGCLLELVIDFQFWRDKKKRREFEKENNLPKKIMIHPYIKILAYSILIITPFVISFTLYQHYYSNTKNTIKKISQVESLLIENKEVDGFYPEKSQDIIRNNPLSKTITLDAWGNEYYYKVLENKKTFILISKGKDGILNTEDDINAAKK